MVVSRKCNKLFPHSLPVVNNQQLFACFFAIQGQKMPEHSVLLDTFLKLTGPSCCICHIQCLIQDFQLGGASCPSHQFSISSLSPPPPLHPHGIYSNQCPGTSEIEPMLLSMDFGSCFTFDLKFKPKYCFKKILYPENLHFLVLFLFKHNLKCA